MTELSIEEKFAIARFNNAVDNDLQSLEQAKVLLKDLHTRMISQQNVYKAILLNSLISTENNYE